MDEGGKMSTRSQVVISTDKGFVGCLYHHWDGYPFNMIKLLKKSESLFFETLHMGSLSEDKIINFVIAGDPNGYEIETRDDVGMHIDVEYMYYVSVKRNDHQLWLPWNVRVEYVGRDVEVWYDGPLNKANPQSRDEISEF